MNELRTFIRLLGVLLILLTLALGLFFWPIWLVSIVLTIAYLFSGNRRKEANP